MDTFEHDHSLFQGDAGDSKLFVQFYMHYLQDGEASEKEGRAIFVDTEFVKIFTPGDRTNIVDRPVRPSDKIRFSKQYEAFKSNRTEQATGTPLAEWPIITRAQAEELKYLGFQTVEQIADANDNACGRVMGLTDLKNKAKMYLQVAAGNTKPIEEMTSRVKDLESQVKMRDDALAAMEARIKALETPSQANKTPGPDKK